MKSKIYNLLAPHHYKKAVNKLRTLEDKLATPLSRLAIPFLFKGCGHFKTMKCMQNPYEIEELFHIVHEMQPKAVMEIGTAKGGALYLWLQAAHPDATVISLDLPDGEFGGGYPACRIPFYQHFAGKQQNLQLIRGDSHSLTSLEEVNKALGNQQLDFLYIDGDHTYEGVKKDFELYSGLVRKGGLIGLHDILPRPDLPEIQVDRFWQEIKNNYKTAEIIGPEGSGRKIGSGIIWI